MAHKTYRIGKGKGVRPKGRRYDYNSLLSFYLENDRKNYYLEAKKQGMSYDYARRLRAIFKRRLGGFERVTLRKV